VLSFRQFVETVEIVKVVQIVDSLNSQMVKSVINQAIYNYLTNFLIPKSAIRNPQSSLFPMRYAP